MTEVQTFRAATMQEALNLVREELGRDAVILHTRQVSRRRFLPWRKADQKVEITAGLAVNVRPQSAGASSAKRRRTAFGAAASAGLPLASRRLTSSAEHRETVTGGTPLESAPHSSRQNSSRPDQPTAEPEPTADFASKLDSIQKMLVDLGRYGSRVWAEEIPTELFALYTELIDVEVEDELARHLIFCLKQNATPNQLSDGKAARALLTAMVEAEIRCCNPIAPVPGKRKVVGLVGTTGVGKTTTIAKLAANFRLRDGIKMGLVTVDTYRIAAVEQLRTYAEIIDLPMKVVTSPPEMRRALDELTGLDLVLIDTAGRSPRDELQIQELKRLLAEANVDEVHLVMSLTSSMKSLLATAERFAAANTTSLILTKLDEAAGLGTLLSLAQKVPLPISYLTTGQDVPDDIEPAQPTRIARLILGQEKLFDY